MTRGGIAFPLPPSAPRTSVTASSWSPLPTPRGSDANHGRRTTPRGTTNGRLLDEELFDLLPTIRASDGGHGMLGGRQSEGRNPKMEHVLVDLLPTPTATDYGTNQSPSPNAAVRPSLDGELRLLPTITATDVKSNRSSTGPNRHAGASMADVEEEWGLRSPGDASSPPSDAGKRSTGLRRNPSFREWLMGAPEAWTDPASPLSATEFSSTPDATSESS